MRRRFSGRRGGFFGRMVDLGSHMLALIWKCAPLLLIGLALGALFFGARESLYADPYFQVQTLTVFPKDVLMNEQYAKLEREVGGKNLLNLNLTRLVSLILSDPHIKSANLLRRLPNELEIVLTPRKPLVQLVFSPRGPFYTIDEEGVVMAISRTPNPVLIQALNEHYPHKKLDIFDRYQDGSLTKIPGLLNAFQKNQMTQSERMNSVSVDHLGNFSIVLSDGLELRVCTDVESNLKKLAAAPNLLTGEARNQLAYIDLCLKDVVVRKK